MTYFVVGISRIFRCTPSVYVICYGHLLCVGIFLGAVWNALEKYSSAYFNAWIILRCFVLSLSYEVQTECLSANPSSMPNARVNSNRVDRSAVSSENELEGEKITINTPYVELYVTDLDLVMTNSQPDPPR